MSFFSTLYIKTYAFLNLVFTRILVKTWIFMLFCLNLFIHAQKSRGELNSVFAQSWRGCLCACASDVCAENFSHNTRLLLQLSRASCLRAVLISSPGTWDWTRMHALVVMHRWTLYENVASIHRIVIHRIDISMNCYTPSKLWDWLFVFIWSVKVHRLVPSVDLQCGLQDLGSLLWAAGELLCAQEVSSGTHLQHRDHGGVCVQTRRHLWKHW